jgi:hypothetical protein
MKDKNGVEEIARDDPNRLHRINRAVKDGTGWRFKGQKESVVWYKTQGTRGLGPSDLTTNANGVIVSKKRQQLGRQQMVKLRAEGKAAALFEKKEEE